MSIFLKKWPKNVLFLWKMTQKDLSFVKNNQKRCQFREKLTKKVSFSWKKTQKCLIFFLMTQKCLIFLKYDPNFLRTKNVSGNFVTKFHHYLQVCPRGGVKKVVDFFHIFETFCNWTASLISLIYGCLSTDFSADILARIRISQIHLGYVKSSCSWVGVLTFQCLVFSVKPG